MNKRILRDFYDLRQIGALPILAAIKKQASAPLKERKEGAGLAQASISRFWEQEPASLPNKSSARGSKLSLSSQDLKEAAEFIKSHAAASGREASFSPVESLKIYSDSVVIPSDSFSGIVLWKKLSPAEFEAGMGAFFSAIKGGPEKAEKGISKLPLKTKQRVAFALGILVGGVDFMVSSPTMVEEGLAATPFCSISGQTGRILDYFIEEKSRLLLKIVS